MPLDERAFRTIGFREDIPIVMGDGGTWFLPRPVVEFGLMFQPDGRPSSGGPRSGSAPTT